MRGQNLPFLKVSFFLSRKNVFFHWVGWPKNARISFSYPWTLIFRFKWIIDFLKHQFLFLCCPLAHPAPIQGGTNSEEDIRKSIHPKSLIWVNMWLSTKILFFPILTYSLTLSFTYFNSFHSLLILSLYLCLCLFVCLSVCHTNSFLLIRRFN